MVIGVVQKKFVSNDHIYGEAGNPFYVKLPQKVTSIKIEIRDSSGKIVPLDPDNVVWLKIVRSGNEVGNDTKNT